MTSADLRRWVWVPLLAAACGGGSSHAPATCTTGSYAPSAAGPNVLPISVAGAGCLPTAYFNEPCVSVTVCTPNGTTCQTIGGLLLDTGSIGLRVFSQALGSLAQSLPAVTDGGNPVAECIAFLDGSSQWGPVVQASVVLGGEPAVTVPIHVIDSTFATRPSPCSAAQTDPASAGYNGILGVGNWIQDCGAGCAPPSSASQSPYYACSGSACSPITVTLPSQVTNPVAVQPTDRNGVIVQLPPVPLAGAPSATGALVLGIGTRANNAPGAAVTFPLDLGTGDFQTLAPGRARPYPAFLDTGSNGIFFPTSDPRLTTCRVSGTSWFCPSSPIGFTATNLGAGGTPSAPACFQIESVDALAASVGVAPAVGGPDTSSTPQFDWGLPFHFGRNVYVGIENATSPLGTGPYVAY